MYHNRLRRYYRAQQRRAAAPTAVALAALPTFAMQGALLEIYRLAREQAEAQLARNRAARRRAAEWN